MKNRAKKIIAMMLISLMLGAAVPVAAFADSVTRVSCTMLGDGASERGFCWYTAQKSASDLQIVKTEGFNGSFDGARTYSGDVTFYRSRWSHQVRVYDLEPATSYTYRVGDAQKGLWSEPCRFVTDDMDGSLSFVSIADVQAGSDENFARAANTLKAAFEVMPEAEFVVNLGDYVNDNTNDEWDSYFKNFSFANNYTTQVPVAGNHDGNITNKLNTNCFKNMFALDEAANRSLEGVYYSFDYGNVHFAVLNTNDMYPMSQAQRNWLVNDMSSTDAQWKVLLMHRSLYSAGKNINKPDTVVMRNVLLPIIDALHIDIVLAGHDHMYLRTDYLLNDASVGECEKTTETVDGVRVTFDLDPKGTMYVLPSTAGTKRYNVNENALPPILDVAQKAFSTKEMGGTFCTTRIIDNKLIYNAYTVDDETGEVTLVDNFAIKKTEASKPSEGTELSESFITSVVYAVGNFFKAVVMMLKSYFVLLFN